MPALDSIKKIEFTAEIIREHSYTSRPDELGTAKCTMELFIENAEIRIPKNGNGFIEWIVEYVDGNGKLTGDDDVEGIGVWFENRTLTDYDGVFSLPKQAVQLLRQAGIRVPREFEE